MKSEAESYRMRVLSVTWGLFPGWSQARDDVRKTKRGQAAIARLLKDGLIERMDGTDDIYRITDAGRDALPDDARF